MRAGDYVRTKDGYIDKIKAIEEEEHQRGNDEELKLYKIYQLGKKYYDEEFNETCEWVFEDFIIKSSPNIIDLIEVGDYVNGQKVFDKLYDELNNLWYLKLEIGEVYGRFARTYEQHIKSIVTKEQFKSMQYEVN